jgi:hypothetical protein
VLRPCIGYAWEVVKLAGRRILDCGESGIQKPMKIRGIGAAAGLVILISIAGVVYTCFYICDGRKILHLTKQNLVGNHMPSMVPQQWLKVLVPPRLFAPLERLEAAGWASGLVLHKSERPP